MNFEKVVRAFVLIAIPTVISCNPVVAGPSPKDISRIFGLPVSAAYCTVDQEEPGVECTFTAGRDQITEQFVRLDDGSWKPAPDAIDDDTHKY
jgi:hypothetical protein